VTTMEMEMDFAKFTSIRWKAFGRCCDPGSGHIVVSRKKSCRTISRFFNSSTTHANEEKLSSNRSLSAYSPDLPETPDEPVSYDYLMARYSWLDDGACISAIGRMCSLRARVNQSGQTRF